MISFSSTHNLQKQPGGNVQAACSRKQTSKTTEHRYNSFSTESIFLSVIREKYPSVSASFPLQRHMTPTQQRYLLCMSRTRTTQYCKNTTWPNNKQKARLLSNYIILRRRVIEWISSTPPTYVLSAHSYSHTRNVAIFGNRILC